MMFPTGAKQVRSRLGIATLLLALNLSCLCPFAAAFEPAFAAHPADGDQLNLPSGCALEATRFKALHPGSDSGILIVDVNGGQHAFVAYPKEGHLWSHCTMLGDQDLGLNAREISDTAQVQKAFIRKFRSKLQRIERHLDKWPVPESRQGDTTAIQIVRAAQTLTDVRVKNAIVAFARPGGGNVYAVLMAWKSGVSVYTPQTGSIQPGAEDFTAEIAVKFAKEHLKFVPVSISYVAASDLLHEERVAATNVRGGKFPVAQIQATP